MKENLYTPDCIRTFTGLYMNVFEPTIDMVCIEDIAHALSNQCRFGGHIPQFYSVAQHSILACKTAPNAHKRAALLHDASEAYLLDIPRPIKNRLANYKEIEDKLMRLLAEIFGFEYPLHKTVKEVDEYLLSLEWNALMLKSSTLSIECLSPYDAKKRFLTLFNSLHD